MTGTGLLLAATMALLADPLTYAMGLPAAASWLRILALAFGLGSIGIASNSTLERDLRFGLRSAIDVLAYGALGIVTVAGLRLGWGVGSLAWGYVAQGVVQSGIAVAANPPWKYRGADRSALVALVRYSVLLWGAALLAYLSSNLDNALVGRLGGARPLGIYALAYTIGTTVTISISQVLNRVALPYYARSVHNGTSPQRIMRDILGLSGAMALVPAAAIIATAPELATALFKTSDATLPLIVLSTFGVVRSVAISMGTATNGLGRPRYSTTSGAINVGLMALTIPPAYLIAGISGVAVAVLLSINASTAYLTYRLKGVAGVDAWWFLAGPQLAAIGLGVTAILATSGSLVLVRLAAGLAVAALGAGVSMRSWLARHVDRAPQPAG